MTDGSINFDTKIDSSGAKKDLKGLSGTLKRSWGRLPVLLLAAVFSEKYSRLFQTR